MMSQDVTRPKREKMISRSSSVVTCGGSGDLGMRCLACRLRTGNHTHPIELADKEHVAGRLSIGLWKVPDHLKDHGAVVGL